eukprot:m.117795 g.117795  ORF g.117795 m.117795 type:complete len:556 (-) comp14261_c0_seq2:1726-3393(-)
MSGLSEEKVPAKRLGVWGLLCIAFFWTCGGTYGNETLVQTAPMGLSIVALILVPLVYSVQLGLISKDFGEVFPEDGGLVLWVRKELGHLTANYNSALVWLVYCVDAAVYPVMTASYLTDLIPSMKGDDGAARIVTLGTVALILCVKICGIDTVARVAGLFGIISLFPSLIFVVIGLPKLFKAHSDVFAVETSDEYGDTDFVLLVSWGIWLNSGFISLGVLAGQVDNPNRTYAIVLALLFPIIISLNILPPAVANAIDVNRTTFTTGKFTQLAGEVGGDWLKFSFGVGAVACMLGLHNSQSITAEHALADIFFGLSPFKLPSWPGFLFKYSERVGLEPIFCIVNAGICAVLTFLNTSQLVEYEMLLQVVLITFVCLSYMHMKKYTAWSFFLALPPLLSVLGLFGLNVYELFDKGETQANRADVIQKFEAFVTVLACLFFGHGVYIVRKCLGYAKPLDADLNEEKQPLLDSDPLNPGNVNIQSDDIIAQITKSLEQPRSRSGSLRSRSGSLYRTAISNNETLNYVAQVLDYAGGGDTLVPGEPNQVGRMDDTDINPL